MKKVAITLPILVVLAITWGLWMIRREMRSAFARDAVHMIAYEVTSLYRTNPNPTQGDIDDVMLHLHMASVINLTIDSNGKPRDPFGNPIRVRVDRKGKKLETTVTSPGPDGRLDTADDIAYVDVSHE
ncbi:MAG TPA: hypothetical protein VJU16_01345 [Planctomycetota bacterium]|nr:hypothetical protein [Planctomycetota bacterium]